MRGRDHGVMDASPQSTQPLAFRMLGPIEVVGDSGAIELGGAKQRALLASLLLRAGRVVPTDVLVDEVWGPDPPPTAPTSLRNLVARLRKSLGAATVVNRPPGYALMIDPAAVDAAEFERLVAAAQRAEPVERLRLAREALAFPEQLHH